MFLDGHGLHQVDQEYLVRDVMSNGVMAMMAMGARQEACLWLQCGLAAGVPGMDDIITRAARWWLRSYPVSFYLFLLLLLTEVCQDVTPLEVRPMLLLGWVLPGVRDFWVKLLRAKQAEERGRRRGNFLRDGWEQVQMSEYTGRLRLTLLPQPLPYGGRAALEGASVEDDWAGWLLWEDE